MNRPDRVYPKRVMEYSDTNEYVVEQYDYVQLLEYAKHLEMEINRMNQANETTQPTGENGNDGSQDVVCSCCGKNTPEICGSCVSDIAQETGDAAYNNR